MIEEFVDVQKASGGTTSAILNVIAALMVVLAFFAMVGGGGGLGGAVGLYVFLGALFLFAFASIVANLSKIVWILQRSKLSAIGTAMPMSTGEPISSRSVPPRGVVQAELSHEEVTAQAASVEEFNRGRA